MTWASPGLWVLFWPPVVQPGAWCSWNRVLSADQLSGKKELEESVFVHEDNVA